MLSNIQEEIVNSEYNNIVVLAAAAAGKTAVLCERVRHMLHTGIDPKKMVVITFTNMAAGELRMRLGADYKDGLFIGTIHSLANYFLLSVGVDTSNYLENEKFDNLFNLVKQNPHCIKDIEYLLLDEAQDSSDIQFEFIFNMIKPNGFFVVGDLRQTLYTWNGSNPDLLKDLSEREDVILYSLNENYRNCKDILGFARNIIGRTGLIDDSIAMRDGRGSLHEVELNYDAIIRTMKKYGNWSKWAILTRTNAQVDEVMIRLQKAEIPCDTFKQGDLKKEELTRKMKEDTVKVLTIHSSKGLEWDNVIVVGARFYPPDERFVSYVAATRARDLLVWTMPARKKKMQYWG